MGMTSILDNCSGRDYTSQVDHFSFSSQHNICTSNIQSNKSLQYRLNGNSPDLFSSQKNEEIEDTEFSEKNKNSEDVKITQVERESQDNNEDDSSSRGSNTNAMVKSDQVSSETSQLFRDFLQGKDGKTSDKIGNNNNVKDILINGNDMETATTERSGHLIQNMIGSFNGSDNEQQSINSGDLSMDESNFSSTENIENGDDSDTGDGQFDVDNGTENGPFCNEDSKEAKRARVENILTSMKHSPLSIAEQNGSSFQESRRTKRKQYQPQQHEAKWLEHSSNKYRKVERLALQDQLLQLQHQLQAVQKRIEFYDKEQNGQNLFENMGGQDAVSEKTDSSDKFKMDSKSNKVNNGPLVGEQLNNNRSSSFKQAVSEPLQQLDVENLANSLKNELTSAVSSAIDITMNKFLEERSAKIAEKQKENERRKEKEEKEKETKEKEELKPVITPIPSVSSSPHKEQFHDHIGSMARILEKASAFEAPRGFLPDFARSHHHPLPFPLPFSYFPPSQVLHGPSLYSCAPMPVTEPEQTEALPLVVNTPKKKRTKVTDTRLSPRAARALLQDTVSFNAHGDPERHPLSSFPNLIPPVLPTSVAIPNPSLQHSDVMSFYRDHPFLDAHSTNHSPLQGDHPSPSMISSPSEGLQLMKSEMYDGSSEGLDGQNMPMISFLK